MQSDDADKIRKKLPHRCKYHDSNNIQCDKVANTFGELIDLFGLRTMTTSSGAKYQTNQSRCREHRKTKYTS